MRHGTHYAYVTKRCRCDECVTFHRAYVKRMKAMPGNGAYADRSKWRPASEAFDLMAALSTRYSVTVIEMGTGLSKHTIARLKRREGKWVEVRIVEALANFRVKGALPGAFVDAAPARRLLLERMLSGYTVAEVATASGVSDKTCYELLSARYQHCRLATYTRLRRCDLPTRALTDARSRRARARAFHLLGDAA